MSTGTCQCGLPGFSSSGAPKSKNFPPQGWGGMLPCEHLRDENQGSTPDPDQNTIIHKYSFNLMSWFLVFSYDLKYTHTHKVR